MLVDVVKGESRFSGNYLGLVQVQGPMGRRREHGQHHGRLVKSESGDVQDHVDVTLAQNSSLAFVHVDRSKGKNLQAHR